MKSTKVHISCHSIYACLLMFAENYAMHKYNTFNNLII